jgi:putative hydrolase of the HAD superfamily
MLSQRYNLALLTDGFLPAQEYKVKALGIAHYFKIIIYTESLGRQFWKPSHVGFEKIATDLNCPACNCVYIGDNIGKDFVGPNSLGYKTIQIVKESSVHQKTNDDPKAQPQFKIKSLLELPQVLEAL